MFVSKKKHPPGKMSTSCYLGWVCPFQGFFVRLTEGLMVQLMFYTGFHKNFPRAGVRRLYWGLPPQVPNFFHLFPNQGNGATHRCHQMNWFICKLLDCWDVPVTSSGFTRQPSLEVPDYERTWWALRLRNERSLSK
ncbi:hypothetical protein XELAEV_18019113mg [Xenopus laevis]|uniref:Uncharacterized protein n=1 Tax=Xenopus laevis TaxID=8355 RepID=A0A974HUF1_XENLA|nr:hypothetical protein XELAEV_18019113mg [Xenopus laevis]